MSTASLPSPQEKPDKGISGDFSMSSYMKTCPKCGARWMGGKQYWAGTGAPGNEKTLHNLVCNLVKSDDCINPMKKDGEYVDADSWSKRRKFIDQKTEEINQKFGG